MSYLREAELTKLIFTLNKNGLLNQKSLDNYANVISNLNCPTTFNVNEYVPLTSIDTKSWTIKDNSLVCNYAGIWQIISQYQIVGIRSVNSGKDATIEGWFNINGINIKDSCATGYVSKEGGSIVLTIAYSQKFNKNDTIRFGIRSNSTNGHLNIGCLNLNGDSGINIPSFIGSLTRIN